MAAMMAGAVFNMIDDPVAIFVLGWGIQGADAQPVKPDGRS